MRSTLPSLPQNFSHLKQLEDLEPPTSRHPIITSMRQVLGLNDRTRLFALAASHSGGCVGGPLP